MILRRGPTLSAEASEGLSPALWTLPAGITATHLEHFRRDRIAHASKWQVRGMRATRWISGRCLLCAHDFSGFFGSRCF